MMFSPDIFDVMQDSPPDEEHFCILVQVLIGTDPADHIADTFSVLVCSPDQLVHHIPNKGFLSGRGYLFLQRWDSDLVRMVIEKWCEKSTASSWEEVVKKLCCYMDWEYDT